MRSPARTRKILCCSTAILLLAGIAFAGGEFWEKKDYTKWSEKECKKLLEDSPWTRDFTEQSQNVFSDTKDATDSLAPYIKYVIQLRSAKPIQQAMIRQMQILNKYEKLTPEQKQQFDKSAEAFIASIPVDGVVVHVSYSTNNQQFFRDLIRHWQAQTADLLKNTVYLSGNKGEKVPIAAFAPAGNERPEFQFIFPRTFNDKPIISPEDKQLRLEFEPPVLGQRGNQIGSGRAFIEFKLEKMKIGDQVVF